MPRKKIGSCSERRWGLVSDTDINVVYFDSNAEGKILSLHDVTSEGSNPFMLFGASVELRLGIEYDEVAGRRGSPYDLVLRPWLVLTPEKRESPDNPWYYTELRAQEYLRVKNLNLMVNARLITTLLEADELDLSDKLWFVEIQFVESALEQILNTHEIKISTKECNDHWKIYLSLLKNKATFFTTRFTLQREVIISQLVSELKANEDEGFSKRH
jgi:hypothetical protein